MITFTLPAELRQACLAHPKELYDQLLQQSAQALRDVIATKTNGGVTGFTSVLHTWGRQLQHHPHVHCIVPALAWHPSKKQLIHAKDDTFLIHFRPLAARLRNLMRQALQNQHPEIYQNLNPLAKAALEPSKTWNAQLQHVGRGHSALRYLARYVKRSAIGPKRLIGYDKQGNIRLHWTSSQTGKPGILTFSPHELIRRWLVHVLPKGFARVRHYGFLSAAATRTLQTIRLHLGVDPQPELILPEATPHNCPCCGGLLTFLREIAPIHLLRAPPRKTVIPCS
jgi:Putative transposase